jgi:ribosome production factor 1
MVEPLPGENRQEQRRIPNPTIIDTKNKEFLDEISTDELAPFDNGDLEPRVKITTEIDNQNWLIPFAQSLENLIPNSIFVERENIPFASIRQNSIDDGFSDLLVLAGSNGNVYAMYHLHLPNGPSACYRITSIVLPKNIPGHAVVTKHYPEIILKRFETNIGRKCGRMLKCLFPARPQFIGRRVCLFHHQRDFIFFRHYRYVFNSINEAKAQEAGPQFTLRLIWFQDGTYDPSNGIYAFYRRQRHEKSRRKWAL